MELNVLIVEDDKKIRENLQKAFDQQEVAGHIILATVVDNFEESIRLIKSTDFDIVILDLYKDKDEKSDVDEDAGLKILAEIRKVIFVPVVFYTGHAHKIENLVSEVVGVVSKGEGLGQLIKEIERLIASKLALLKRDIYNHVNEQLRDYFWETIDSKKEQFSSQKDGYSLGYLILRRLANSLSKENIKKILGDDKIRTDKAHPMEFYIYPTSKLEYESGEILLNKGTFYVILTPSCDFVEDLSIKRKRTVGMVLLAIAIPLEKHEYYADYKKSPVEKNKEKLKRLIETRKGDRFFFLPGTPFIPNLVLDFQFKTMLDYADIDTFERITKLDSPFAQSMVSSFVRYYNRIGFPDIDAEYVIDSLN